MTIEAEGQPEALAAFVRAITAEAPPLAHIESIRGVACAPHFDAPGFEIALSEGRSAAPTTLIAPDAATCDDCLRELFDPADRRYRYPFINCTNCGPRFTIVTSVPYDRQRTTMADFQLCAACNDEYEDPSDRRFHAEPIACPDCGPGLTMPLDEAVDLLRAGRIVAVKGLGGYHLACDATNEEAVARLRDRRATRAEAAGRDDAGAARTRRADCPGRSRSSAARYARSCSLAPVATALSPPRSPPVHPGSG